MTPKEEPIKAFSVRWPDSFWEQVSIESTKRRSSLQEIVTLAVAKYLKIEPPATKKDAAA